MPCWRHLRGGEAASECGKLCVATTTSVGNGAKRTMRGLGAAGKGGGSLLCTLRDIRG